MPSLILTELPIQKDQRIRLCILAHTLKLIKKKTKPKQDQNKPHQQKKTLRSPQRAVSIEGAHCGLQDTLNAHIYTQEPSALWHVA